MPGILPDFSEAKLTNILNSELADCYGNLLSRCTGKTVNKNQTIPRMPTEKTPFSAAALSLLEQAAKLPSKVSSALNVASRIHFVKYSLAFLMGF